MNIKRKHILLLLCIIVLTTNIKAAENDTIKTRWQNIADYTKGILRSATVGMEYRIKAGIAIGGTSPIPIPLEIQKIEGFNPLLNISIETEFLKTFSDNAGLSVGIRLETKGMETNASVKNYNMKMISTDGGEISGVWTGMVKTRVNLTYLTLPVLAVWKPGERWDIKMGPYLSYQLNSSFSGSAYDGYLREGSPVGKKIEFEGDNSAIYDFSSDLRRMAYGLQLGANWRAFPHLLVGLDLTWGLNSIFKKKFDVITFNMYPIYLNLNFGYAF